MIKEQAQLRNPMVSKIYTEMREINKEINLHGNVKYTNRMTSLQKSHLFLVFCNVAIFFFNFRGVQHSKGTFSTILAERHHHLVQRIPEKNGFGSSHSTPPPPPSA